MEKLFAGVGVEELFESLIELHTPICASVADASASCAGCARTASRPPPPPGLRLGSAGTHPFSLFERQRVTGRERYRALVDDLQYAARRELVGMHVHVAVDDPDRAVRVVGALQAHWQASWSRCRRARRSGVVSRRSCRHLIFSAFPRSGPPPQFRDYEEFAAVVAVVACGWIQHDMWTWWDVRLHPRFGTVEVRVYDAA